MSTKFAKHQRPLILLLLITGLLSSCSELFDPDQFSDHQFDVINRTEEQIWVQYHTESRLVDAPGSANVEFEEIDSAYLLLPGEAQEIMRLQFSEYHRGRMDIEIINQLIFSLQLFHIDGTDTVPVLLDSELESNWDYYNSDPLPFSTEIVHNYRLEVKPEHID